MMNTFELSYKLVLFVDLNAGTRIVDQITNIVTPLVTGVLMAHISKVIVGFVIIGGQMVAMVIEIGLLTNIYNTFTALQHKNNGNRNYVLQRPISSDVRVYVFHSRITAN